MQFETLLFERRDQVAVVTLNRPDRLNALNGALIADLTAAAAAIEADSGVRAAVLTGAGRAFCSGADLMKGGLLDDPALSPGESVRASLTRHFNPMISAWYHLRAPVVVAVNGIAAGAGASLALTGDLVLAARSAVFLQLFAPKLGLMPDLGSTFFLPRLVGSARAKGLTMLGAELSADKAADWGLIWEAVDDAALGTVALGVAQRLAQGPSQAFARIKAVFNTEPPATLEEQLAVEALGQAKLADTQDFAEGMLAFRGKRPPKFKGC